MSSHSPITPHIQLIFSIFYLKTSTVSFKLPFSSSIGYEMDENLILDCALDLVEKAGVQTK